MAQRWYIRSVGEIGNRPIPPPRTISTLRRSIVGNLVVFPMDDKHAMPGWGDGRTIDEMREYLRSPQARGTWYRYDPINDVVLTDLDPNFVPLP